MNSNAQKMYDEISQFIQSQYAPLYSTDGVREDEKRVILKMYDERTGWRWTVYEGQVTHYSNSTSATTLFGRVQGFEDELGYFDLQEIVEGTMKGIFSYLQVSFDTSPVS